uniref:Uncharacterized protein n=1 Tax=Panagrolaimus davidi TaxID=227884 RepID=A0A914PAJ9_9BILA
MAYQCYCGDNSPTSQALTAHRRSKHPHYLSFQEAKINGLWQISRQVGQFQKELNDFFNLSTTSIHRSRYYYVKEGKYKEIVSTDGYDIVQVAVEDRVVVICMQKKNDRQDEFEVAVKMKRVRVPDECDMGEIQYFWDEDEKKVAIFENA